MISESFPFRSTYKSNGTAKRSVKIKAFSVRGTAARSKIVYKGGKDHDHRRRRYRPEHCTCVAQERCEAVRSTPALHLPLCFRLYPFVRYIVASARRK